MKTRLWLALKGAVREVRDSNLGLTAAGVAFFGMLAIFPGVAAIIAIWGLVADPAIIDAQLDLMRGIMPSDVFDLFDAQMTTLTSAGRGTLGWASLISILIALWSARAGIGALMIGLDGIYKTEPRGGLTHYLEAIVLTIALVGVALTATALIVVAPIVLAFFPIDAAAEVLVQAIRWAAAISVLLFGLGLIYRFGPNRPTGRAYWLSPGSLLVVFLWAATSSGFSIYLSNFGNYNEVYGSIGAAIALLMWLYLSAYLILFGAALNAELEASAA